MVILFIFGAILVLFGVIGLLELEDKDEEI